MIEHCISALNFDREREKERKSFEMYVTDALKAIAGNTTHHLGMGGVENMGVAMTSRWIDVIEPPETVPVDERPCAEIAEDIFARIRGKK